MSVWLRAPLCVVLIAALGITFDSALRTNEQQKLNSVLALAPPAHSATIQANRGEQRAENARQRTTAGFPFIVPADNGPDRDRGSLVVVAGYSRTEPFDATDTRSARSPPRNLLIN